jgi:hypothetical protein
VSAPLLVYKAVVVSSHHAFPLLFSLPLGDHNVLGWPVAGCVLGNGRKRHNPLPMVVASVRCRTHDSLNRKTEPGLVDDCREGGIRVGKGCRKSECVNPALPCLPLLLQRLLDNTRLFRIQARMEPWVRRLDKLVRTSTDSKFSKPHDSAQLLESTSSACYK